MPVSEITMPSEQEFKEVMELIGNELWHNDVYTEIEGNWVSLEFERIVIGIQMWRGIVTVYDNERKEEIYRVE